MVGGGSLLAVTGLPVVAGGASVSLFLAGMTSETPVVLTSTTKAAFPLCLRPYQTNDEAWVFRSWLGHQFLGLERTAETEGERREQRRKIPGLVKGGMVVACDPDEDRHRFGWCCGKVGVLHYAFVDSKWRRLGVGETLRSLVVGPAPFVFTHRPPAEVVLARGFLRGGRFEEQGVGSGQSPSGDLPSGSGTAERSRAVAQPSRRIR